MKRFFFLLLILIMSKLLRLKFSTCLAPLKQDGRYDMRYAPIPRIDMLDVTSLIYFVLFYFIIELPSIFVVMTVSAK